MVCQRLAGSIGELFPQICPVARSQLHSVAVLVKDLVYHFAVCSVRNGIIAEQSSVSGSRSFATPDEFHPCINQLGLGQELCQVVFGTCVAAVGIAHHDDSSTGRIRSIGDGLGNLVEVGGTGTGITVIGSSVHVQIVYVHLASRRQFKSDDSVALWREAVSLADVALVPLDARQIFEWDGAQGVQAGTERNAARGRSAVRMIVVVVDVRMIVEILRGYEDELTVSSDIVLSMNYFRLPNLPLVH